MNKPSKDKNRRKTELLIAVAFTGLMFILSWSDVMYIPVSDTRLLDLSLVPVVFVAMIGGYSVAIPVAIGWWLSASMNQLGAEYHSLWILTSKLSFSIALVYFYSFFKKIYYQSPWNVHRTIVAAVTVKNIIVTIAMIQMFPHVEPQVWIKDTMVQFTIEMAICLLSMSLLVEKLRKIHILNGIRRKEKQQTN
jgi:hypothetical protein